MEKEDEPRWKTPEVNDGRILVARRNLRIHQRNHSWGSEQYLQKASSNKGFDFSQLDLDQLDDETEGDQPRDAKTSIGGSSEEEEERPPSRRWEPSSSLHCICMVSDFFYPDAGGVENHMYMLSQCLLQLGHKVIVVTRARGNRQGVRWLTNGLKVYYLPLMPMPDVFSSGRVTLPTLFSSWPIFRFICIRERVTIVHGHQAFSIICHESLMHAGTMGLKVIFTDHSLFGFSDPSAIHMNKVLNFTLSCINHVICVSHTSKENTVLRASIEPSHVSVIPNAVDTSVFTPNPTARKSNCITIVCITRLVYRKGVDLMVEIIPSICQQFEHVNFVIGGDGPMRVALEQMRENHQLQDRVEMLGHVRHTDVRNVLVRGHIYLNCSLTEAFCIAILEAASCGLLVVSTRVGGVPEVMPSHMIKYASPDANSLIEVLKVAISKDVKEVVPSEFHANIKKMYSWHDVAKRTCKVYDRVVQDKPKPLLERLKRCHSRGPFFGILIAFLVAVDFIVWQIICWIYPEEDIEIAVDYPYHHNVNKQKQSTKPIERIKDAPRSEAPQALPPQRPQARRALVGMFEEQVNGRDGEDLLPPVRAGWSSQEVKKVNSEEAISSSSSDADFDDGEEGTRDLLDTSLGRDEDDTRGGGKKVGTESEHEGMVRGFKDGETKEGLREGDGIQASLHEPGWKKFLGPVANNREY